MFLVTYEDPDETVRVRCDNHSEVVDIVKEAHRQNGVARANSDLRNEKLRLSNYKGPADKYEVLNQDIRVWQRTAIPLSSDACSEVEQAAYDKAYGEAKSCYEEDTDARRKLRYIQYLELKKEFGDE